MEKNDLIKAGERLDDLHRSGYMLIQNSNYFSFGMDAVLLAYFAKLNKHDKHLDLCCGNGVIPILVAARQNIASHVGIEIQKELADMARRSLIYNNLEDKIEIVHGDVNDAVKLVQNAGFDVVTANPPYIINSPESLINTSSHKAIARHEILCTLNNVCAAASWALRFGGRFYMVHRPARLADIFCSLRAHGLEPKTMMLVQSIVNDEPNIVLISSIKGGKPQLNVLPNLVVYDKNGSYTKQMNKIYYG